MMLQPVMAQELPDRDSWKTLECLLSGWER